MTRIYLSHCLLPIVGVLMCQILLQGGESCYGSHTKDDEESKPDQSNDFVARLFISLWNETVSISG